MPDIRPNIIPAIQPANDRLFKKRPNSLILNELGGSGGAFALTLYYSTSYRVFSFSVFLTRVN